MGLAVNMHWFWPARCCYFALAWATLWSGSSKSGWHRKMVKKAVCLTTGNSYSSHRKHGCHVNGEKNEEVPQFQRLIIGQKYTKSDDGTLHLSILLLNGISPCLSFCSLEICMGKGTWIGIDLHWVFYANLLKRGLFNQSHWKGQVYLKLWSGPGNLKCE